MNIRHSRLSRIVVLAVVVSMPLLGMSGVASAKAATTCHKTHSCKSGGSSGGSSGGNSGSTPAITVSAIGTVIEVETSPSFAGQLVNISSTQLVASCGGGPAAVLFESVARGSLAAFPDQITVALDDDGNATVVAVPIGNCAPGDYLVDASLTGPPYLTATTEMQNAAETPSPAGVYGSPNPEVETGDTTTGPNPSGDSDVYAEFAVETSPVYAEQPASVGDTQLESSCGGGWIWLGGAAPIAAGPVPPGVPQVTTAQTGEPTAAIDNDGNAFFIFMGISCAANTSTVIADVDAGNHPTYTSTYTVLPPAPTI